jgi:uncharacterized RDD family membrane protein YckC
LSDYTLLDAPILESSGKNPYDYLAPVNSRIVNYMIDMILYMGMQLLNDWHSNLGTSFFFIPRIGDDFLLLCYYVIFEAIFGKTLGKTITRTRVVTTTGKQPDVLTIIGRTLCRLIPFDALSFLGSSHPRGWHDRITSTLVVREAFFK